MARPGPLSADLTMRKGREALCRILYVDNLHLSIPYRLADAQVVVCSRVVIRPDNRPCSKDYRL